MGAPSSYSPSFKHVPALDGVRGLAVLLVLGFHLLWSNWTTGSRIFDIVVQLRSSGWIGVDLFFALSGYLITGILLDTRDVPHFFRNFYARRALRIFPLYYAVLLIVTIGFHPLSRSAAQPFLLLAAYLQNTPLWWRGHIPGLTGNFTSHLWSLAAEEQFYLVWPLVVFFVPNRRTLLWICTAVVVLSPAFRYLLILHGAPLQATYKLTLCRADGLLAGAALAIALRGPNRSAVLRFAPVGLFLGCVACLAIAFAGHTFDFQTSRAVNIFAYSALAIACASLIGMAVSPATWVARSLRWRVLRFFGKYSYGLYILHQMVAALVEYCFGGALRSSIPSKPLFHLVFPTVVLAITLPLAMLSYHHLERPFLRLKTSFDAVPPFRKRRRAPHPTVTRLFSSPQPRP